MHIARWTAAGLFILAVPLLLVLTNVRIAATEPRVYEYSFSQYDAPARSGIERSELDRAARDIVRYFRNDDEFLTTRVTVDGEAQPLYTTREVLHMRDVKALFGWAFRLHELALVYIAIYVAAVFLWSGERQLRHLARQSVIGGAATVGVLGLAALAVLIDFDTLFRRFHLLSFSNDLWELNVREHHLIQMFPQGFWFDVTLGVGILSAMQGGLIALGAYAYLAWERRRQPSLLDEAADAAAYVPAAALEPLAPAVSAPLQPPEPPPTGAAPAAAADAAPDRAAGPDTARADADTPPEGDLNTAPAADAPGADAPGAPDTPGAPDAAGDVGDVGEAAAAAGPEAGAASGTAPPADDPTPESETPTADPWRAAATAAAPIDRPPPWTVPATTTGVSGTPHAPGLSGGAGASGQPDDGEPHQRAAGGAPSGAADQGADQGVGEPGSADQGADGPGSADQGAGESGGGEPGGGGEDR